MIEVSEATQIILDHSVEMPMVTLPIQKSMGRVLMEDILADHDFPPFHRIMMDGIAIQYEQFKNGQP